MSRRASVSSIALWAALAWLPVHAAERVFVSSTGIDRTNNVSPNGPRVKGACEMPTPCRTFQAAHNAVSPGGEIVALDTADYGPVTIAKSVAIIGLPGIVAGISAATGHGVTIASMKSDVQVRLRNLYIQGVLPFGDWHGVSMTAGSSLTIENCVIWNFSGSGVAVDAAADVRIVDSVMRGNRDGAVIAGNASADVVNSQFMGNGGSGLRVESVSGTTSVSVSDSVASGNGIGFAAFGSSGIARMSVVRSTASSNFPTGFSAQRATAGARADSARMTVSSSMASGNGTGFWNSGSTMTVGGSTASGNSTGFRDDGVVGGSVFRSLGDNILRNNFTDFSGVRLTGSAW